MSGKEAIELLDLAAYDMAEARRMVAASNKKQLDAISKIAKVSVFMKKALTKAEAKS